MQDGGSAKICILVLLFAVTIMVIILIIRFNSKK
jgi:hypothetical protein